MTDPALLLAAARDARTHAEGVAILVAAGCPEFDAEQVVAAERGDPDAFDVVGPDGRAVRPEPEGPV